MTTAKAESVSRRMKGKCLDMFIGHQKDKYVPFPK